MYLNGLRRSIQLKQQTRATYVRVATGQSSWRGLGLWSRLYSVCNDSAAKAAYSAIVALYKCALIIVGRSPSPRSRTLTCNQTPLCGPGLPLHGPTFVMCAITCITTHLPTPEDWSLSWPGWLTNSGQFSQPMKWSPVNHRSGVDQEKSAGQRQRLTTEIHK